MRLIMRLMMSLRLLLAALIISKPADGYSALGSSGVGLFDHGLGCSCGFFRTRLFFWVDFFFTEFSFFFSFDSMAMNGLMKH